MQKFCHLLPKIELHAHLGGSIRNSTIAELIKNTKFSNLEHVVSTTDKRTLEQCFQIFDVVHEITNNMNVLKRITTEILTDFANENTKYLELRTTPRILENKYSKRDYVQCVVQAMNEFKHKNPNAFVDVKLLLSVNRGKNSLQEAFECVELVKEFQSLGVVGLDFSGNPYKNQFSKFMEAFSYARSLKIPITIHLAEIVNHKESFDILNFVPERVGHACFLNDEAKKLLLNKKIPLEICIDSNLRSKSVKSVEEHQFKWYYDNKHPVVLCTDDMGIFCTTLSKQYEHVANTFKLSQKELFNLSYQAIDYIFAGEETKKQLKNIFDQSSLI